MSENENENLAVVTNSATSVRVLLNQFVRPEHLKQGALSTRSVWAKELGFESSDATYRVTSVVHRLVLPAMPLIRIQAGYDLQTPEDLALDTAEHLLQRSTITDFVAADQKRLAELLSPMGSFASLEARIAERFRPVDISVLDELDQLVEDARLDLKRVTEADPSGAIAHAVDRALDDVLLSTAISRKYSTVIGLQFSTFEVHRYATHALSRTFIESKAIDDDVMKRLNDVSRLFHIVGMALTWIGFPAPVAEIPALANLIAQSGRDCPKAREFIHRLHEAFHRLPQLNSGDDI